MAKTNNDTSDSEYKEIQTSFMGGMNRAVDPSRIGENEYTLLVNGRARYDTITPIKLPLQLRAGLPDVGNLQGIYGAGSIVLVFIDGLAYYRDFDTTIAQFRQIAEFHMSADAPTIWAELVPASTLNFKRQFNGQDITITTTQTGGTLQAVVVQDGINQPWLILPDGSARESKRYGDWDTNREYVPVGCMMLYTGDGILHTVSPNKKGIYNSVTGRPLDFVIIVDENGNKLPSEAEGGAEFLQHKVDYADITCISRIDTPVNGAYLVTTARASYIVTPKLDDLLFGEPKYSNTFLFSTGALNNFSVNDILGDTTLIDFAGIRSFNAVTQYRIEGKNSPFFAKIFRIFENINQTTTASWTFDNYGFYAVNTIYGFGVAVYDTLLEKWVGIDMYSLAPIKQFCEVKTNQARILFFATTDGKVYQAFSGDTAVCQLYTKEWNTGDPETELTLELLHLIYLDVKEQGQVRVTPYVDRKQYLSQIRDVDITKVVQQPEAIPFGKSDVETTENMLFNFQKLGRGWKGGFLVEWNFNADLSHIAMLGTKFKSQVSRKQQAFYFQDSCVEAEPTPMEAVAPIIVNIPAPNPIPTDIVAYSPTILFDDTSPLWDRIAVDGNLAFWNDRISGNSLFANVGDSGPCYPIKKSSSGLDFGQFRQAGRGSIMNLGSAFCTGDEGFSIVMVLKNANVGTGFLIGERKGNGDLVWQLQLSSTGDLEFEATIDGSLQSFGPTVNLGTTGKCILAFRISPNGVLVRVNGQTEASQWTLPGDVITLGDTVLTVGGYTDVETADKSGASDANIYAIAGWQTSELSATTFKSVEQIYSAKYSIIIYDQAALMFCYDTVNDWLPTWVEGTPEGTRDIIIENASNAPLDWIISITTLSEGDWITATPSSGGLKAGEKVTVTLSLNDAAASILAAEVTGATVTITNQTNGQGDAALNVVPTVT